MTTSQVIRWWELRRLLYNAVLRGRPANPTFFRLEECGQLLS
jgi:hypothetical protein